MLRAARIASGLAVRELAERVGVTPAAIANIEFRRDRPPDRPSLRLAQRIEAELGRTIFPRGECRCSCGTTIIGDGYAHNHEARERERQAIERRRDRLVGLLVEGYTQVAAAKLLGVSVQTISSDVAARRAQFEELGVVTRRSAPPKPTRPSDTVSLSRAARVLGEAPKTTLRLVASGRLPASRFGREWAIDARSLVDVALERGVELWSLRQAAARTGVPRFALRNLERDGRLRTLPGPQRSRLIVPAEALSLLAELERNPDQCPAGDGPVNPGRVWHRECHLVAVRDEALAAALARWSDPDYRARESDRRSEEMRRQWRGPRAWRRAQPLEKRPCHVCAEKVERPSYKFARLDAERRRVVCGVCCEEWTRGLFKARWAVRHESRLPAATRAALAVGEETEKRLRALRPPRFGRRPRPLAVDLAIEALHVWRNVSDAQVLSQLRVVLETAAPLNRRYVTDRRTQGKIQRPERRKTPANHISP